MENKSSNQFWIDVSADLPYLEKKSNVLRWSFLKYDISMETFWSVFFYSFVIHKLIPIKSVLCQHNYIIRSFGGSFAIVFLVVSFTIHWSF